MKQRLLVAFLTALVFGSGYGAALWIQGSPAVPPPPATLGAEFSRPAAEQAASKTPAAKGSGQRLPRTRAELAADIERLRPQIDAFRARLEQIDADFERDLQPILTDAQRTHLAEAKAEHAKRRGPPKEPSTDPLTDEQILRLSQQPLYGMMRTVVLQMKLDEIVRDLKLDDAQRDKVRDLLQTRREKFLSLVDSSPPPSLLLSRLAPVAQRLAEPKK